jgi:hypothetical protein
MKSKSNPSSRMDNPPSNKNKQEGPSEGNNACIKSQDKSRTEHVRTRTHRSPRSLLKLEWKLNLTPDSLQGFTYATTTTKPEPLQVENYKMSVVFWLSLWGGIYSSECDLHRLGEDGLTPGGGRVAKPHG